MKALIVENIPTMLRILRRVLSVSGFSASDIYEASNGREALTVIQNVPDLNLILSDWYMPEISGVDLLRIVREDLSLKTPFIMVTVALRRENVVEAMRLGVTAYVAKPFTFDILQSRILKAISDEHSRRPTADFLEKGHSVSDGEVEGVPDRRGGKAPGDTAPG